MQFFFHFPAFAMGFMNQIYIYIERESAPNNSYETYISCVWAEQGVLGSAKTAVKFKCKI